MPIDVRCVAVEGGGGVAQQPRQLCFRREHFAQQGPSGPIEAELPLRLELAQMQQLRIELSAAPPLAELLGLCTPPPLLVQHIATSRTL